MSIIIFDQDGDVVELESRIDLQDKTVTGKSGSVGQFLSILAGNIVGWATAISGIAVRKNSGSNIGTRPRLNFIEGTNVTLDISDDSSEDEIDITINSSGGGGAGWTDDGTIVRLTTASDQVGMGTASPSTNSKLDILGTRDVDNAAGSTLRTVYVAPETITFLNLGVNITTATGFNVVEIGQATYTISGFDTVVVDYAASLYIANAPTATASAAITNAFALWIDAGESRFEGRVAIGDASLTSTASAADANILEIVANMSVASGANAKCRGIWVNDSTITITGSTNHTSATGFNFFEVSQPTYSGASAQTITHAATVYIAGAPIAGGAGPVTITNGYALWADSGNVRVDDDIINTELNVVCSGRLTLTSGTPYTTSDVTAATTIYFTPANYGASIALYTNSLWRLYTFSEVNVTVPSTIYRAFDIFVYDSSGTITLEAVNWNQTTAAIESSTNAAPIVVTSTAHGRSVGDVVGIAGHTVNTNANDVWYISAVTANTFTLHGSTGNGVGGATGNWYKLNGLSRATALTTQNGVYVKSGETNKRYLGTGITTDTSGQTEVSETKCFLWNYYNRARRPLYRTEGTSHTYAGNARRYWNNDPAQKLQFVIGVVEESIETKILAFLENNTAGIIAAIQCGVNNSSSTNLRNGELRNVGVSTRMGSTGSGEIYPSLGYTFVAALEQNSSVTGTSTFDEMNLQVIGEF